MASLSFQSLGQSRSSRCPASVSIRHRFYFSATKSSWGTFCVRRGCQLGKLRWPSMQCPLFKTHTLVPGITLLGTTGVKEFWAKDNAVQQAKGHPIYLQSEYQGAQEPAWIDGQELSGMVTAPIHFVQPEPLFLMDKDCTVALSCYSGRQNLRTVFWPPAGLAKSGAQRKDCVVPFQQLSA